MKITINTKKRTTEITDEEDYTDVSLEIAGDSAVRVNGSQVRIRGAGAAVAVGGGASAIVVEGDVHGDLSI